MKWGMIFSLFIMLGFVLGKIEEELGGKWVCVYELKSWGVLGR